MKIEKRKICDLIKAEYNPRKISVVQLQELKDGIEEFGLVSPLVVNEYPERKNVIVGGHQRLKIWEELGNKKVDCSIVNLPLDKERKLNIKLNKNGGTFDDDLLKEFFDYEELIEWGFTVSELFDMDEAEIKGNIDDDEIPEAKESKVKKGDIWQLGEHRVMCGDSTSSDDVAKLMNGEKADLGLTDPPYNINYNYNTHKDNMSENEYKNFIDLYMNNLILYSEKQIITSGKQNLKYYYNSFNITDFAVWYAKNKMSGSKISNLGLCEPILFIGKFNRNARVNDMFEYNVKQQKDVGNHTCPKVLDFFIDIIKNYSKKIVLDVFLGSGTTLIAAEKLNRKCYGMELDENYCDIIIERWEQFTGQKAEKING